MVRTTGIAYGAGWLSSIMSPVVFIKGNFLSWRVIRAMARLLSPCISLSRAARAGKHVCLFSLEMSNLQMLNRILAGVTDVDPDHLRISGLTAH